MIESKIAQRVLGLLVMLLGVGFTASSWQTALNERHFHWKAAVFFPFVAVLGLCMLLFPIDTERLRAEHGVSKPQSLAHYPPVWWAMGLVAALVGFANLLAIARS